jgi:phage protein D
MAVVTVREESKEQGDFYVPRFEIKIAGAGLPANVLRDVVQVTYKDNVKELDSFEITVSNWDADKREFKYVGAETEATLKTNPLFRLFEPCGHDVEVHMGYGGTLPLMLTGNFTTMEPNFPSSGSPTLTVRGLNVLHKLRKKQYTYAWTNKKESEIAKDLETLPNTDKRGQKRFPLHIEINPTALKEEEVLEYVAQNNQYDIDFLLMRARRIGYVVFIKEEERQRGRVIKPRRLYFGPSDANHPGLRVVTFELKWGLSLIDFKPTLTTANQIKSVTVNGWNRTTKKPITGKASLETLKDNPKDKSKIDPKFNLNRDLLDLLACDAREEHVVDEPVFTQKQADERARAILLDRSKELVKASATCIGLPDLRAGQRVRITGLGTRFSGEYFVTGTTHTINDSGYITKFDARREEKGKQ